MSALKIIINNRTQKLVFFLARGWLDLTGISDIPLAATVSAIVALMSTSIYPRLNRTVSTEKCA